PQSQTPWRVSPHDAATPGSGPRSPPPPGFTPKERPAEPPTSEAAPAEPPMSEAAPAEPPTSEAAPAEPPTSEAAPTELSTSEVAPAEPSSSPPATAEFLAGFSSCPGRRRRQRAVATGKVRVGASYPSTEGPPAMASSRLFSPAWVQSKPETPQSELMRLRVMDFAGYLRIFPEDLDFAVSAAAGSSEPQLAAAGPTEPQPAAARPPRHVPEEPVGRLPPHPRHVPEEPVGGLPSRPDLSLSMTPGLQSFCSRSQTSQRGPRRDHLHCQFQRVEPLILAPGLTNCASGLADIVSDAKPDARPDARPDSRPDTP
ncbi:hypothetical protein CRENBAI_009363, partial [Crenichthys baileyi]